MDIETLAQLLHKASHEVDLQNKKACTWKGDDIDPATIRVCDNGMQLRCLGYMTKETDEPCPRCNIPGNIPGLEPFTPWDKITEKKRESCLIQARYLNAKIFEPLKQPWALIIDILVGNLDWANFDDEFPAAVDKMDKVIKLP